MGLITSVANQLLKATASTADEASEQVLAQLVEHFNVHYGFLRYSDHGIRASVLAAEWPPTDDVAENHPFAVVPFGSDDLASAICENGKELVLYRARAHLGVRRSVAGRRRGSPLVAAAPLISGTTTTGVLGFVTYRGRKWKPEPLRMLEAVAPLLAHFQARISAEQRLIHLAEHDDLTGLRNRRALLAHLSDRLAAEQPGPVALLYLDLDGLKEINDSLGHAAGDWFIQGFAARLSACAGSQSMIARLGGDEFIVVPDGPMSARAAQSFADQLRHLVRDRLTFNDQTITRTVSIGVAAGVPGRDGAADLLHRADTAVLASKRAGGNRVRRAGGTSPTRLFRNDIELHRPGDAVPLDYLPEVDLWTGAVVAAEALVRWQHPQRGTLLGDAFIGVAESMNLAGDLDRRVLRTACAEFSGWRQRGVRQDAVLRVNVSPPQLTMPGFVNMVADTIEEFGMADRSLCLQITERAAVHDVDSTARTLMGLADIGVQTAISDFGTGYAVLSHLKTLPIDTLKIDPQFVRELATSATDLAIVRAIVGLAEAFDLQLVAQGVDTTAAASVLMEHGCPRAQGSLFSPPIDGSAMESLLASRTSTPLLAGREALSGNAVS